MRVGAFLTYMGRLKGVPDQELQTHVPRALERVGLAGVERKRCQELSKGMSQKVQFLAAILHEPELLILDEPFSGLDPVSTRQLRELILAEHARGATILFSTHVMPHAEEICDHVVMIHRGRKVLDESVAALRQRYDPRTIYFEPLDPQADLSPIATIPDVEQFGAAGKTHEIVLRAGADPAIAVPRIAAAVAPARLELARPRLEDIFVQIVTEAGAAEDERGLRADLREDREGVAAL
jgi:ABC-2 type transport system ATP-binding protein